MGQAFDFDPKSPQYGLGGCFEESIMMNYEQQIVETNLANMYIGM